MFIAEMLERDDISAVFYLNLIEWHLLIIHVIINRIARVNYHVHAFVFSCIFLKIFGMGDTIEFSVILGGTFEKKNKYKKHAYRNLYFPKT